MTNIETTAKYYTPELSEIHHGFEFEFCIPPMNKTDEKVWQKYNWNNRIATIELRHNCIAIGGFCIKPENLRVKYLDDEDIESLGFKHDFIDDGEEYPSMYNEHGYSKGYNIDMQLTELDTAWVLYHFPDSYVIIERIVKCGTGKYDVLFVGYLNNKSQLKSVMNLIGITQ